MLNPSWNFHHAFGIKDEHTITFDVKGLLPGRNFSFDFSLNLGP